MIFEIFINPEIISVELNTILRQLDADKGEYSDYYEQIAINQLRRLKEITQIKAGFVVFDCFNSAENIIIINDVKFNIGKIISSHIKNSEKIVLFTVSLGKETDKLIKDELNEDYFTGYLTDAIASEFTESVVEHLEKIITKKATEIGFMTTNRFSPGYCGWNVIEQHKFFSLLPENFCEISLKDSGLMVPVKSVSGIIGFGKNIKRLDYTCTICDFIDCFKRK